MLATAIDRPIVRGTDVMQLRNARITAAVRMLLNKAVSAVEVDGMYGDHPWRWLTRRVRGGWRILPLMIWGAE